MDKAGVLAMIQRNNIDTLRAWIESGLRHEDLESVSCPGCARPAVVLDQRPSRLCSTRVSRGIFLGTGYHVVTFVNILFRGSR